MKLSDCDISRPLSGGFILSAKDAKKICPKLPPIGYEHAYLYFEDDPCREPDRGYPKKHGWVLGRTPHNDEMVWWVWRQMCWCPWPTILGGTGLPPRILR